MEFIVSAPGTLQLPDAVPDKFTDQLVLLLVLLHCQPVLGQERSLDSLHHPYAHTGMKKQGAIPHNHGVDLIDLVDLTPRRHGDLLLPVLQAVKNAVVNAAFYAGKPVSVVIVGLPWNLNRIHGLPPVLFSVQVFFRPMLPIGLTEILVLCSVLGLVSVGIPTETCIIHV